MNVLAFEYQAFLVIATAWNQKQSIISKSRFVAYYMVPPTKYIDQRRPIDSNMVQTNIYLK